MGIINVKEIGAVGDGVTDDSAVFNAAIDLATSSAIPLSIYVLATNYAIDKPLNMTNEEGTITKDGKTLENYVFDNETIECLLREEAIAPSGAACLTLARQHRASLLP